MSDVPREKDGLVYYRPSNGTEFTCFYDRCEGCRHYTDDLSNPKPGRLSPPFTACTWGVLDRLLVAQVEDRGGRSSYFDPADLNPATCPATCLRFTPRDYGFDDRDPPKPDLPGQMVFGEESAGVEAGVPGAAAPAGVDDRREA